MIKPEQLAPMIDHTLLRPDARPEEIERLCHEARENGFAAVCVNSCYVPLVSRLLKGSPVKVCTVVGFPLGAASTESKAFEAEWAVGQGAQEVDMVMNMGWFKAGETARVQEDMAAVVKASTGAVVKVILETCLLTGEEIRRACALAERAGARFVKTSTGFSSGGATVEAVKIMKESVGQRLMVKASGGIRYLASALAMVEAGADRIGTSSGVKILRGA